MGCAGTGLSLLPGWEFIESPENFFLSFFFFFKCRFRAFTKKLRHSTPWEILSLP